MSSNDSTAAGWLAPVTDDVTYDEDLERQLSQWGRAVAGLPDKMMRPHWVDPQPAQLPAQTNWGAFVILGISSDDNPAFVNQADASGELWRHELIECLISLYGPNGQRYASRFRDGLTIPQNNSQLNMMGLSLADFSDIRPVPELLNNQWVRRYDITVRLRRKVVREYGINSLVDAPVTFFGE